MINIHFGNGRIHLSWTHRSDMIKVDDMWDWCLNGVNGSFTEEGGVIYYATESDLSNFLLRWS
jgi:hypothetical protein